MESEQAKEAKKYNQLTFAERCKDDNLRQRKRKCISRSYR